MANLKEIKLKLEVLKILRKQQKLWSLYLLQNLLELDNYLSKLESYAKKINDVLSDIAARVRSSWQVETLVEHFTNDKPKTVDIVL